MVHANTTGLPESAANAMMCRELKHSVDEFEQYLTSAASPQQHAVMGERALTMAAAFASLAEEVIRNATRSDRPSDECWGCINHKVHHNQRFHRFAQCPNKEHDPTVREQGMKKLKEFLEERNKRRRERSGRGPYGPANPVGMQTIESSVLEAQEGHPSPEAARLVQTISSNETGSDARKACYQVLAQHLAPLMMAEAATPPPPLASNKKAPSGKPLHFHFFAHSPQPMAAAMQAAVGRPEVFLEISQTLPHIHLPIGEHENEASLLAMVDSGAGLNLGRLQCHKSIYKQHSDLVEQFTYLNEASNMQEFGLGHVGEGEGPKVSAVIAYRTPYVVAGRPVNVWFGLSDTVTTNTILGLPFLLAADAVSMYKSRALILQKLGVTIPLSLQVPVRSDQAPQAANEFRAFRIDARLSKHVEILKTAIAAMAMASTAAPLAQGAYGSGDFEAFMASHSQQE